MKRLDIDINTACRYALITVICMGVFGMLPLGVASAVDDPYNATDVQDQDEWMVGLEDATLDDLVALLLRVPAFVLIGSGSGELVAGLLVCGFVIGTVGTNRIGFVGGGVAGVLTLIAIASVGAGPEWIETAVLMLVGLVLAVVYLRFR